MLFWGGNWGIFTVRPHPQKNEMSGSVSRVLYPINEVTVIKLDRLLPTGSAERFSIRHATYPL